jgi:hypothetical protein
MTPVANGKNLHSEKFLYFFWTPWLEIFSFKSTLTFAAGIVDTSGKFAAGTVDTGGKFATGVRITSGTSGKTCRRTFSTKIRNNPDVIFRGLGEDDS